MLFLEKRLKNGSCLVTTHSSAMYRKKEGLALHSVVDTIYCQKKGAILAKMIWIKFIYSEKATKFCEISTNYLIGSTYKGQIIGRDFATFCGLLRIYELYPKKVFMISNVLT